MPVNLTVTLRDVSRRGLAPAKQAGAPVLEKAISLVQWPPPLIEFPLADTSRLVKTAAQPEHVMSTRSSRQYPLIVHM